MPRTFRNKKTGAIVTIDDSGQVIQPSISSSPNGAPTATPTPQVPTKVKGQAGKAPPKSEAIPEEPKQLLGGALPILGGVVGGAAGGIFGGGLGAIPGAGVGAAAGSALENSLEDLLGQQQQSDLEQLKDAGKETAFAAGGEAFGLGAGRLIKPAAGMLTKLFGKNVGKALVKSSLPEAGKAAQTAVKKSVLGTGKELSEEIIDRGVKGSAKQLIKTGDDGIKHMEVVIRNKLGKFSKKEAMDSLSQVVSDAFTSAKETVTGIDDIAGLAKEAKQVIKLQEKRIAKDGFQSLWDLRKSADAITKGKAAQNISSVKSKFNAELANQIRTLIAGKSDDLASDVGTKQFFTRLSESATRKASMPAYTQGDILRMGIGGVGGFAAGGPIGAAAGVAAGKTAFSPAVTTTVAQLLKNLSGPGVARAGRAAGVGAGAFGAGAGAALGNEINDFDQQDAVITDEQ